MARKPLVWILAFALALSTGSIASALADSGTSVIYGEVPATVSVDVSRDGAVRQVAGNVNYEVTTTYSNGVPTTTVIPAPDLVAAH